MAGNSLIPKYFEPLTFKSLVLFNVVMLDPQLKEKEDELRKSYVTMYYLLCLQRILLLDDTRNDLRETIDHWEATSPSKELSEDQMTKEGCHISKPYGVIGV